MYGATMPEWSGAPKASKPARLSSRLITASCAKMPPARRHVQRGGAAAVKKERIGAVEPVAEEPRKGVERDLSLGDREQDLAIRAHAHAVARLEGCAARLETRMQASVDHQHRPRL